MPYISVIITAYNRREFLLNAIKSVLSQTLDKKYYEIIVIKNFQDDIIDNFISENNIKGIISTDNSLGGKLIEALNVATGEIISFLEDDDLFINNKLEIVYNKFKNNSKLCYYHNNYIPLTEKYNIKNINANGGVDFNLSSISIEKCIINTNNLKRVSLAIDHFMYFQALESNKKIIKDQRKLTYYMDHMGSAVELLTNNFNQFVNCSIFRYKNVLGILCAFKATCFSKRGINYINVLITDYRLSLYVYEISGNPNNLLKYFFYLPSVGRFEKIIGYALVRIHKNFRLTLIYRNFRDFQMYARK